MTAQWNPSDPTRVGMEFETLSYGARSLSSDYAAAVQKMRCSTGDSIDRVIPYVTVERGGGLFCEAYIEGNEAIGTVSRTVFVPTADESVFSFTGSGGEVANLFNFVNDPDPWVESAPGGMDFLKGNGGAASASYWARLGGLSGALTGQRILSVRLISNISGWPGFPAPWFHMGLKIAGIYYFPGVGAHTYYSGLTWTEMQYNPATGRQWLLAELQTLATAGNGVGIQFGFGAAGPSAGTIQTLGIEVVHCAENRVAFGAVQASATGWQTIPLVTPAGGVSFARSSGQDHTYVIRRRPEPVNVPDPLLGSIPEWVGRPFPASFGLDSPTGNFGWAHYGNAQMSLGGGITSLELPSQHVWPIVLRRTTAVNPPDAQPYFAPYQARVNAGLVARSQFRATGAGTLAVVRVPVRPLTNGPLGNLTVQIRRTSDNVAVGGVATITRDDWDAAPADASIANLSLRWVNAALASPAVISGATGYYFEFTSTGTTGAATLYGIDAWEVVALNGEPYGVAGYQGTTDTLVHPVGTTRTHVDSSSQAMTAPTAPASLTVTTMLLALGTDGTSCAVTQSTFGRLDWTPTALGAAFAYYEIQRREPSISSDWYDIGRLLAENPVGGASWLDSEIRKNVATEYRVRVVRTDGGFSAWRNGNVAVTSTLEGCALIVTSNEAGGGVIARNDTGDRQWQFLNADEWKFMTLYGRDYQVAFRSVSERGIRWPISLIVYGSGDQYTGPPQSQNWETFGFLESFAVFGVQTVAVLTEAGDRAFGVLRLISGTKAASEGHLYLAEVEFTETRRVPVVVERTFGI